VCFEERAKALSSKVFTIYIFTTYFPVHSVRFKLPFIAYPEVTCLGKSLAEQ